MRARFRLYVTFPQGLKYLACRADPRPTRFLIFNCTSGRSGTDLLSSLLSALSPSPSPSHLAQPFDHVVFCTNTTFASGDSKGGASSAHLKDLFATAVGRWS